MKCVEEVCACSCVDHGLLGVVVGNGLFQDTGETDSSRTGVCNLWPGIICPSCESRVNRPCSGARLLMLKNLQWFIDKTTAGSCAQF